LAHRYRWQDSDFWVADNKTPGGLTIMNNKVSKLAIAGAMMIPFLASDSSAGAAGDVPPALVNGNTAFALEIYQRLRPEHDNLFFSPHSVSTALAMTYAGARGETERDLARTLHFNLPQAEVPGAFAALGRRLNEIGKANQVALNVANSLWCQRDFRFTEQFLDVNRKHFRAQVGQLDFVGESEAARQEINTWVARETADKIKDLIEPGVLGPLTRLILCNAIYFKGDWSQQFDPKATKPADFFVTPERAVEVPMMYQKAKIRGNRFDGFGAFELPYHGGALSMIVLLPESKDGLQALENRLTATNLSGWLSALDQARVVETMVYLPRFKLAWKSDLKPALAALGQGVAFSGKADFSGMTGARDLFISRVIHQAMVDVNEQGTEAAAATAVEMRATSAVIVPTFRADRPFTFLIRENRSGSILFLGRVVDPTK
jgi:serpin B